MFDEVIKDYNILNQGYIEREGFVFTSVTHPANIFDGIIVKTIKQRINYRGLPESSKNLEEHIRFINQHQIEKAEIIAGDLEFLLRTNTLKYLIIDVNNNEKIDYSPLYFMSEIKLLIIRNVDCEEIFIPVDLSKIKGLEAVWINGKGYQNYEKIEALRSLSVSDYKEDNLRELFSSKQLDSLQLLQCRIKTLDGIEKSEKLQCLYLYYNRYLYDISELKKVKKTLKALRIENCPKIEDFSVLAELENLELLQLWGKNTLPSLDFIKSMKNLKTFTFNMNVLDGDLSPCLNLEYVYSDINRKHYNLKDTELPKKKYVRGNEDIEEWRRME